MSTLCRKDSVAGEKPCPEHQEKPELEKTSRKKETPWLTGTNEFKYLLNLFMLHTMDSKITCFDIN